MVSLTPLTLLLEYEELASKQQTRWNAPIGYSYPKS